MNEDRMKELCGQKTHVVFRHPDGQLDGKRIERFRIADGGVLYFVSEGADYFLSPATGWVLRRRP